MINTAATFTALICLLVARAAAIKCLSCSESARPRDCQYVQQCGIHEKCSIVAYITTTGVIKYNVGCMDNSKCAAVGRKRDVLNTTHIGMIRQKDALVTVSVDQWDQNSDGMSFCIECCDSEICNVKGCGEQGLPPNSGPICYGCDQSRDPDTCDRIVLCGSDYACYLSTVMIGVDLVYKGGCIHKQDCHRQDVLGVEAYRDVDITNRLKRTVFCNKCCTNQLCNSGICSSLAHPPTILSPITTNTAQTGTNLEPVNGGWNSWSQWNYCSVTCGGGNHYRDRICNNPAPANGGAMCSGPNNENISCNDQPCPVDGEWNSWSQWNLCSVTCGEGQHYRVRFCNNPVPASGGAMCRGESRETQTCNDQLCAVPETCPTGFEKCPDGTCEAFYSLCEDRVLGKPGVSILG